MKLSQVEKLLPESIRISCSIEVRAFFKAFFIDDVDMGRRLYCESLVSFLSQLDSSVSARGGLVGFRVAAIFFFLVLTARLAFVLLLSSKSDPLLCSESLRADTVINKKEVINDSVRILQRCDPYLCATNCSVVVSLFRCRNKGGQASLYSCTIRILVRYWRTVP